MASCNEDFGDWTAQKVNEQEAVYTAGNNSVVATAVENINFANVAEGTERIKIANLTPISSTDPKAKEATYKVTFDEQVSFDMNADGTMAFQDLKNYIEVTYGRRPVERTIEAVITANISAPIDEDNSNNYRFVSEPFKISATPVAPNIEEAYYYIGATTNWDPSNMTYKLTNGGGDVYDDPVFTCIVPAPKNADGSRADNWMKIAPASAFASDDFWGSKGFVCAVEDGNGDLSGRFAIDGGAWNFPASDGAVAYKLSFNMLDQTYEVTPLNFDKYIFFIGATDGWANAEQKLVGENFDGKYTGYLYCADPNGWGNAFKFQKIAGDWGSQLNSGSFTGGITGDFADGGDNINATAGEGVYYVEMDLIACTLKATFITNMNLVGDFNGWNQADNAQQMTWNATDYCWEITGATVNTNGWKFTANNSWDINLGGKTLNNLEANGDNITVAGPTIKLYPTRKTSDNIYCTVE